MGIRYHQIIGFSTEIMVTVVVEPMNIALWLKSLINTPSTNYAQILANYSILLCSFHLPIILKIILLTYFIILSNKEGITLCIIT